MAVRSGSPGLGVCAARAARQHRVAVRRGAAYHGWAAPTEAILGFQDPENANSMTGSLVPE
eukprot:1008507-Prymnesium_polylepis.1